MDNYIFSNLPTQPKESANTPNIKVQRGIVEISTGCKPFAKRISIDPVDISKSFIIVNTFFNNADYKIAVNSSARFVENGSSIDINGNATYTGLADDTSNINIIAKVDWQVITFE